MNVTMVADSSGLTDFADVAGSDNTQRFIHQQSIVPDSLQPETWCTPDISSCITTHFYGIILEAGGVDDSNQCTSQGWAAAPGVTYPMRDTPYLGDSQDCNDDKKKTWTLWLEEPAFDLSTGLNRGHFAAAFS